MRMSPRTAAENCTIMESFKSNANTIIRFGEFGYRATKNAITKMKLGLHVQRGTGDDFVGNLRIENAYQLEKL